MVLHGTPSPLWRLETSEGMIQTFKITVDNRNLSLETMKAVDVAQWQSIASQAQDHELDPSTKN